MKGLPDSFTTREAFDILNWQGSRQGLSRHLQADGYEQRVARDPRTNTVRRVWSLPALADPDAWQCGSDREIAKLALLLVERNRVASLDAFHWIEGQITAAGPRVCREMTERFTLDEVPF